MLQASASGAPALIDALRAIDQQVIGLGKLRLRVGIIGPGADQLEDGSDLTLAELGKIHEFGAPAAGIPERSFLRSTMAARASDLRALWATQLRAVIARQKTPRQALEEVGQQVVAWIQATIRAGIEPPLWEETMRRKGSSKPLIDHGQLINSITYLVEEVG